MNWFNELMGNIVVWEYILIGVIIIGVGKLGLYFYKNIGEIKDYIKMKIKSIFKKNKDKLVKHKTFKDFKKNGFELWWKINHMAIVIDGSNRFANMERRLPRNLIINIKFHYDKDTDKIIINFSHEIPNKFYDYKDKFNSQNISSLIVSEMIKKKDGINRCVNNLKSYDRLTFENFEHSFLTLNTDLRCLIIEILNETNRYENLPIE